MFNFKNGKIVEHKWRILIPKRERLDVFPANIAEEIA